MIPCPASDERWPNHPVEAASRRSSSRPAPSCGLSSTASPLLGPLLALVLYLGILHWRFETGWFGTGAIGGVAWLTAVVVVTIGATLGLPVEEAIGIPAT